MRYKKVSILFMSLFLVMSFSINASAEIYGKTLNGGVKGRYFNIPPNAKYKIGNVTRDYGALMREAVRDWNDSAEDHGNHFRHVDVNFTESSIYRDSQIRFAVAEFGNIGWDGFTRFLKSNGTEVTVTNAPTDNWDSALCQLNASNLHNQTVSVIRRVAGHEMGHGIGLAHTINSNTDSIMQGNTLDMANYTTDYDIDSVNDAY